MILTYRASHVDDGGRARPLAVVTGMLVASATLIAANAHSQEFSDDIAFRGGRVPTDIGPGSCGAGYTCATRYRIYPNDSPYYDGVGAAPRNLFHEFESFDSALGTEIAFVDGGETTIANVVAMIEDRDGNASMVGGYISSEIDGASLFLINPDGFVFGPDARIDTSGSLYVATADRLILGEENEFNYVYGGGEIGSPLLHAEPSAFGFTAPSSAAVHVRGVVELSREATDLRMMVVAPNVDVGGDGRTVIALGPFDETDRPLTDARVALLTTGGDPSEISLSPESWPHSIPSERLSGSVTIQNSNLQARSKRGNVGRIVIRSGELTIANSNFSVGGGLPAPGDESADPPSYSAFDAKTAGNISISSSVITSTVESGIGGNARIISSSLELIDSSVKTQAEADAVKGGDIEVRTRSVDLEDAALWTITSGTGGSAGAVDICAGSHCAPQTDRLADATRLGVVSLRGFVPGRFTIPAEYVGSAALAGSSGDAGRVEINARHLSLENRAQVYAFSRGRGSAGEIEVNSRSVLMTDGTVVSAAAFGDESQGQAGSISFSVAENFTMSGNSLIVASASEADAGNIRITAGDIRLIPDSTNANSAPIIEANKLGPGRAGSVELVAARDLLVLAGSKIQSSAKDSQDSLAGNIALRAGRWLAVRGPGTQIGVDTVGMESAGGDVSLAAPFITLEDSTIVASALEGGSVAGNIVISPGRLFGRANAALKAEARTSINEGRILIESPEIDILDDLVVLQEEFLDVTDELSDTCMARKAALGSFQVVGNVALTPSIDQLPGARQDTPPEESDGCESR